MTEVLSYAYSTPSIFAADRAVCFVLVIPTRSDNSITLRDQLHNTTSLLDLPLGLLAEVARLDDQRNLGYPALAEHLCVTEGEEVEDGSGVGLAGGNVLFARLGRDERPELWKSKCQNDAPIKPALYSIVEPRSGAQYVDGVAVSYLVQVDDGLPELVVEAVVVAHTDLSEVTGVVLVDVGAVVVLSTGHTATTGMLAVLADTSVTGGDVTAAAKEEMSAEVLCTIPAMGLRS